MLTGVLDANVAIGLAKGEVLDRLRFLYTSLYLSPSVKAEVIAQGSGLAGAHELTQALGQWIVEVTPDPQEVQQFPMALSMADREVLAIARATSIIHVLSDDKRLCREANRHGLTCLGAPQVVVLLKRRGLVPAVKPVLDLMRQRGYGIADGIYQTALRAAGE